MSYILDSLKKSDQERKRGTVPDLSSVHAQKKSDRQRKRTLWPLVLPGLLLLNSGVLLAWLQPWEKTEVISEVPTNSSRPATTAIPKRQTTRMPRESTTPIEGAKERKPPSGKKIIEPAPNTSMASQGQVPPAVRAPSAGQKLERKPPQEPPPAISAKQQRPGAEEPANMDGPSLPQATGQAEFAPESEGIQAGAELAGAAGKEGQADPAAVPSPRKEAEEPKRVADQAVSPGGGAPEEKNRAGTIPAEQAPEGAEEPARLAAYHPEAPPVVAEKPPETRQLPGSMRRRLPEIHISAHFFSKRPASRLVSVNGRILREGQEKEGLRVEEITPSGVVFSFAGKKFFESVLRP